MGVPLLYLLFIYLFIILANFLKTNLTKFAVISVKKPQKTSPKIIARREKKRRKRKSEEKERRRRKKVMSALLVFIIASLDCWTQKGLLGDNVIKNSARIIFL